MGSRSGTGSAIACELETMSEREVERASCPQRQGNMQSHWLRTGPKILADKSHNR